MSENGSLGQKCEKSTAVSSERVAFKHSTCLDITALQSFRTDHMTEFSGKVRTHIPVIHNDAR